MLGAFQEAAIDLFNMTFMPILPECASDST
jgi:hypothetical protein